MRTLHKIKRIVLILTSVFLIFFIGLISWYNFAWPRYIDKDNIKRFASKINDSDKLPDKFYSIYDKIYPGHRHTTITKTYFIGGFKSFKSSNVPSELISPTRYVSRCNDSTFLTKRELMIKKRECPIYFSIAISKFTKPDKCFDYYVNSFDFLYGRIGLDDASRGYFNKEFSELTSDEIIGLITMLKNPVLFNPHRFPDNYYDKVIEFKALYEN